MSGRWDGADLLLELRVQPRAAQDELVDAQPRPRLRVRAPAVDDRANLAAIEWLAEAFGVAKAQVAIVRGQRGRDKLFRIHAPARVPVGLGIAPAPASARR
jgi:uncharacterized protein (TIGR00251 family)